MWKIIQIECNRCGKAHNVFCKFDNNNLVYAGHRFPCGEYGAVNNSWLDKPHTYESYKEVVERFNGKIIAEYETEFLQPIVDLPRLCSYKFNKFNL